MFFMCSTIKTTTMKTYIINPETNKAVSIDAWKKEENPARAELVALELNDGADYLIIRKTPSDKQMTFPDAQEYAAGVQIMGRPARCATRKESIDLYDARFLAQLDEAMELIDGRRIAYRFWTCEKDVDPDFANLAWSSDGSVGCCNYELMCNSLLALPLLLLPARFVLIREDEAVFQEPLP